MARILEPGDIVKGPRPIKVVETFAQGGQGILYVAEDKKRKILLKQVNTPTAFSPDGPDFLIRCKVLKRVFDSNPAFLPTIYDIFTESGIFYITYRLLEGQSLN